MSGVWVVIPTYEEAGTVGAVCRALRGCTVLVVDDGSPDGTADLAAAAGARVLRRPGRAGLGAAYRAGFAAALDGGADVVVQMDADGSHDPADVPRLLAALEAGADVAVGSRYVDGGSTDGWPASRRALSRAGGAYARAVLHSDVRDLTAGFKAWRGGALRSAGFEAAGAFGYGFQIEMAHLAELAGLRVAEVAVTFRDREAGRSKMSAGIALEALWLVPALRRRHRRRRPRPRLARAAV